MAVEKIITPGVYTYENDNSFRSQGASVSGLAVVGPTEKGPAFIPTDVSSYAEYVAMFGSDTSNTYVPQTVSNYLTTGTGVKVVRVLGNGGWTFSATKKLTAIVTGSTILTVFHPSKNDTPSIANFNSSSIQGTLSLFGLTLSGSGVFKQISASLNVADPKYILNLLGTSENFQSGSGYALLNFANYITGNISLSSTASLSFNVGTITFTSSYAEGYDAAKTPWILSDQGVRLFRFIHRSHGHKTNKDIKIAIANIKKSIDPTVFTVFTVLVRKYDDKDTSQSILEQYTNVSLDPNAANYIGRVIGDKFNDYDSNLGTVIEKGDFANASKYVRLELADSVKQGSILPSVGLGGHEALFETIAGFTGFNLPTASMILSNSGSASFSGMDYNNKDNFNYLNPVPSEATAGLNVAFTLPTNGDKFVIPLQGGTDGINPAVIRKISDAIATDGTNVFGMDLSSATTAGTSAFRKALDILSNKQDYKFDLLVIPGVIAQYHNAVTTYATTMAETRQDTFYIQDLTGVSTTVASAVNQVAGIDSNYSATYYPWVRLRDIGSNKLINVPPSVVVPQAYAYNDRVAAPWYAPAGINRGTLGSVVDVYSKITKDNQASLYDNRINPIIRNTQAGGGIVIFGQKTLQLKATALDRINVRRLMIYLKKIISDIAVGLVFDQNVAATRNGFLAKANPLLESIQQRNGIYAFRIVMDESNNTADVIDRNQLIGQLYIQPAKVAEFIQLEFNISPSGTDFT